jgi:2'-5' RNA ligase
MEPVYTSSFLGIPLPDSFRREFAGLLNTLTAVGRELDTVNPATPHITVCFLDRQPISHLEAIAEMAKSHLPLLRGATLTIRGLGVFEPSSPRVIFLGVEFPDAVDAFYRAVSKELPRLGVAVSNAAFHPHLTVARLRNREARELYAARKREIASIASPIRWEFPLTELVVYGVSAQRPAEGQQKLIRLAMQLEDRWRRQ